MSLPEKFLHVMKDCAYVRRQGENAHYGYRYATAADVLEKVNAALVSQGIISLARPVITAAENVTAADGGAERRITVEMNVTLTDTATGESLDITGYGCGQDRGDKAVMKAQTAALKYAYMLSLGISTGDDPEADAGLDDRTAPSTASCTAPSAVAINDPAAPPAAAADEPSAPSATALASPAAPGGITPAQQRVLLSLVPQSGFTPADIKALIQKVFGVASSRDLTWEQAAILIRTLREKVAEDQMLA